MLKKSNKTLSTSSIKESATSKITSQPISDNPLAAKKPSSQKSTAKKQLKKLLKSAKSHPLRNATRVTKYGASGFTRNLWLSIASIFVISITLIVLTSTIVANLVLLSITDQMRDKIDITLYLQPETTNQQLLNFSKDLYKHPNIRTVSTADSKQELEKFIQDRKDTPEIVSALKDQEMYELLLKSMNATINIKLNNVNEINQVKSFIEQNANLSRSLDTKKPPTYETKRTIIERIKSWANTAKIIGLTLSLIFLIISSLMIINTIKIAIFSRREEIYMMKLVGASKGFIKGPFLVEAEISGIISGIIAAITSISLLNIVLPYLIKSGIQHPIFSEKLSLEHSLLLSIATISLGTLIGAISARIAISKYAK